VKIESDDTKGVWDYFIDERYFNIPALPGKGNLLRTAQISSSSNFINPCLLLDEQSLHPRPHIQSTLR
jgi:hypothetical protein